MTLQAPTLADVTAARARIAPLVRHTPALRFEQEGALEVYLKAENLQPIGSFKIRGAANRMLAMPRELLERGAYTASAGNMAQGVAYAARALGVPSTVVVPDTAPAAKLEASASLGARVVRVSYAEWWAAMERGAHPGIEGVFVHPFADQDVMAGNGTIAAELVEDVAELDAVLVPWGGGGLACGIAAAMRVLRPSVPVYACEVEGAAPLQASLAAGRAVSIENHRSFIDGIGGRGVFPAMWLLAQSLLAGTIVVRVDEVAECVRLLAARSRIVAEGAGAAALAAALRHRNALEHDVRRVACIVSGGNIDPRVLSTILRGETPR